MSQIRFLLAIGLIFPCFSADHQLLPLVFTKNALVNIVTLNQTNNRQTSLLISETFLHYQKHALNTFISWTTGGLNLRIPDKALANNISLDSYYFKLQQKVPCKDLLFILITEGNFLETVNAIDNSGFGTSSSVPFFVLVNSLIDQVFQNFIQPLEDQLRRNQVRPFHANIIFFSNKWDAQLVYRYYCAGSLNKLLPFY